MAGLGAMAGQVGLVAELRWRLFVNVLRTPMGQLEMVARILVTILAGLGALGIGAGLATLTFVALERGRLQLLSLAMWALFACWLLVPVLLAGMGVEFDFQRLLRFPLRFSAFATLSLIYGLLDPPSLVALFWTGCVAAGVALARPELLPGALAVLAVFTAANLLMNRVFLSWLQKILERRRTREAFIVILILSIVGVQLVGALAERWEARLGPLLKAVAPLVHVLPPGAAGRALVAVAESDPRSGVAASALLFVYGLGAGLLLRRRLQAQYFGEAVGEGVAAKASTRAPYRGWNLPGLSSPVAAMCEKELRYAMRNGQTWLSLLMPLVIVVFFSAAWSVPRQRPGVIARSPELFLPGAVAYGLLILTPLMQNTFAFEGRGIQFLLVAPARMQNVFLAKNLVHGAMALWVALATWALRAILFEPPSAAMLAMTLSALLPVTLAHLMIGNALSLYFPRQIEFGSMRKRASQMNALIGLLCQVVLIGGATVIAMQARKAFPEGWLGPATLIYLTLGMAMVPAYRRALDWAARAVFVQREKLLDALAR